MKPFDLEAAKRGEPIVTRDGRPAKFIAHVPELSGPYKILTLIGEGLQTHTEDGLDVPKSTCPSDLFMAPKKVTRYVNLYNGGEAVWHETETDAKRNANSECIAVAVPVAAGE